MPYRDGLYLYYDRTVEGLAYQLHCRREVSSNLEEVILDENNLAQGHDYCDVGSVEPSPSHAHLAYSVDFTGEQFLSDFLILTRRLRKVRHPY